MSTSESRSTRPPTLISAPQAYALLIKEFARLKPPECTHCRVPLPFWGPAPNNKAYWYMQTPRACAHGCGKVLLELWARFTTEYQIAAPEKEHVSWMRGVRVTEPQG